MILTIIGSGGCVSTPRPCCNCKVCVEARKKGFPYARTGCSLFIDDVNILIDTPEDINVSLNNANIDKVEYIMYSHCDPDHTMGLRVIEQLRMDWLGMSIGIKNIDPIHVVSLPVIIDDMKQLGTRFGSVLNYYKKKGLVTLQGERKLNIKDIKIEMIPVDETEHVTVFVITQDGKKIIYAPCDVKPFPDSDIFYNADVLIIGNTIVGDVLKDGFVLKEDNPLREELFDMEEIEELKKKYHIQQVVITHLEEDWGKSYNDYKVLEKNYTGITFAYDGMSIKL